MYDCHKCGACCRNIKGHRLYAELDDGEGGCVFFDANSSLCKIYRERPLQCRVDDAFEAYFKGVMSEEAYYSLNRQACKMLREQEG